MMTESIPHGNIIINFDPSIPRSKNSARYWSRRGGGRAKRVPPTRSGQCRANYNAEGRGKGSGGNRGFPLSSAGGVWGDAPHKTVPSVGILSHPPGGKICQCWCVASKRQRRRRRNEKTLARHGARAWEREGGDVREWGGGVQKTVGDGFVARRCVAM